MEVTSKDIYAIYRQAKEIKKSLEAIAQNYAFRLNDSIKIAGDLSDELFSQVGKFAAYEIDNEYWENKRNEQ